MQFYLFLIACLLPGLLCGTSWVIIADGDPLQDTELQDCVQNRKVLVLDGAINRFKSLPFYPDCMLGDFDSIEDPSYWGVMSVYADIMEDSPHYIGNFGIMIVPAKDQNYTDLEKGIVYCDKQGSSSIFIVQATGGRMDHTLGNLGLLRKYYHEDRHLVIETKNEQIFYLRDNDVYIEGGIGKYCAVMGYPKASMTTSGLAYNGNEYPLELGIQESICNTIADSQSVISIRGEALIILPKSCVFELRSQVKAGP
jgi:thiamine pyrophosphokinase